ncbi:hypothetical protein [Desulfitobacterium sp. AusDCA]|uniref:hypothetical protein n=1 Tax=Desulfitobacterium sp. AusDCA TaxID=3240383 RepID=UPI003DA72BCF
MQESTYNNMNAARSSKRWDNWEGHRNQINRILHERVLKSSSTDFCKAAIFGAGNCDDIDLNYWLNNVDELWLFDIDLESVQQGIERQNIDTKMIDKLKLFQIDVTGLDKISFFNDINQMLKDSTPIKKVVSYIRKIANNLEVIDDLINHYGSFSFVASSSIHTQLLYPHFNQMLSNTKDKETLMREADYLMSTLVKNYNQLLLNLVKENGTLFIWTDEFELSSDRGNLHLLPQFQREILNSNYTFLSKFIYNFGLKGAVECNKDLLSKFPNFADRLIDKTYDLIYWIWHYDLTKHYLIHCFIIRL